MTSVRTLALALLVAAPLAACKPPAPPAPPASPSAGSTPASDKGFIGRRVEEAMTEARKELRTKNISISDGFNINVNGHEIHTKGTDLPKAEISPQGDLLVEGKRMEAKGKAIEAEAMKLCTRLPSLLASQQALAVSVPEFKPYARMTQEDIDDCNKESKDKGVSITTG